MLHVPVDALTDRHTRILDAAERCFARAGIHRTTMQDVASEAGMSPGNLYRYFPSKDALAAGLAERDRAQLAADFGFLAEADDFVSAFKALGRKHFMEEPRERSVLCLEIWAEATRNPNFAAMTHAFERELVGRMSGLFADAQRRGRLPGTLDPHAAAVMVSTLANGLFVRRAVAPGFDAEREVAAVLTMIGAVLRGAVDLSPSVQPEKT
ncbi:TetR/AcrR family transcriptional regulator [Salinarimonas soli]|uniref:TetR/AcrR family transcriptional regulator n=1 Tax=Salinarimonas soli TaxID=1638099 RepID=A0A5B2VDE8_9HYPH|nr:TetR/AcrR family transcriptional regulator [Salinarimonas soli]KAA2236500.1 TetR/AcrR family transcriptional regulator [Salinarimonas soli]